MSVECSVSKYVVVGKITGPFGIKGQVKIHSFTSDPSALFNYPNCWFRKPSGQWETMQWAGARPHGEGWVANIKGVTDCNTAESLKGAELAILRESLPPLPSDEYYWTDLEGMSVYTPDGARLGAVAFLYEAGAADVMVVKEAGTPERHIPFVIGDVVKAVSVPEARIVVDWM